MGIKYHVRLSDEERSMLESLIKQKKPRVAQHKKRHAQILLAIDENDSPLTNQQIAKALSISPHSVISLRKRFVEEGLEVTVNGKHSHQGRRRKIDGEFEAHLIALACSTPPEGHCRWTLNLLRDKMLELEYTDNVSRSSVHNALKKMNLNHG